MIELADFAGDWRLERVIDDRLDGPARFTGTARFETTASGLCLNEEGVLQRGAARFSATQCYQWRQDGRAIAVLFADGRDFHRFVPQDTAVATHRCDPDTYHVTYDFARWPAWSAVWRATGPRKDYTMRSDYRR